MDRLHHHGTELAPRLAARHAALKDETPGLGGGGGFRKDDGNDAYFPLPGIADQALSFIEGEEFATAFLDRLHSGTGTAADLATVLGFLDGDMLLGACRVLCKALEGRHHA